MIIRTNISLFLECYCLKHFWFLQIEPLKDLNVTELQTRRPVDYNTPAGASRVTS